MKSNELHTRNEYLNDIYVLLNSALYENFLTINNYSNLND